jgi:hypothetical protein
MITTVWREWLREGGEGCGLAESEEKEKSYGKIRALGR